MKDSLTRKHAYTLGLYAAIATTVLTVVTFVIAIFTPPLSGPLCSGECLVYPFSEAISRFPRDYVWMYPAMVQLFAFVILAACIHRFAASDKKIYSLLGYSFALLSAALLITDYFLQVTVVQPSLMNGETDGIALLTQYNAHGIFIALEELGYLLMSTSLLFMAPVFAKDTVQKALRIIFLISFALTALSLAIISLQFGVQREYRFELAVISINWLALIPSGILLSLVFKRALAKLS